jgi:hypothetical protein
VTSSFEDHVVSEPNSSLGGESAGRRFIYNVGLGRILPKPRVYFLPTYVMPNTSPQGILERENRDGRSTDIASNTLSVHFSLDNSRQGRGPTVTDQETDDLLDTAHRSKNTAVDSILTFSSSNTCGHANGGINATEYSGRVTTSKLGRRGKPGNHHRRFLPFMSLLETPNAFKQQPRGRPSTAPQVPPIERSQVDPGEDISVVVRREGPGTRNVPPHYSVILSTRSTNSRRRSRSVETEEEQRSEMAGANRKVISRSRVPATLEEARNRIQVLSALTEITGGKRRSQTDQNLLEVSVVTQTDRRVETRKHPPRSDLFEDYDSRKYSPRGCSPSSSGGL